MDVDKKIRLNIGILLTLLLALIPMYAWKIGYQFEDTETWRIIALSFAKIGAFGGMAMFALSLILSGRYHWYDKLFGGLDKMYIAHRFLGTFSLILLFVHPLSLSILTLDEGILASVSLWFKISDFGVWLGAMALYGLIALVMWSIFGRSKYETFIKVHRLLGLVFIASSIHAFMSGSILATNSFMYWYMMVLTVLGSATFITYSVIGDLFHRPLNYKLDRIGNHAGDIVELILTPRTRAMNFAPGQFVYIQLEGLEEHGYHPFSVRSSKRSSQLVLAIRKSGDFTNSLSNLKSGAAAKVKGPYGGFVLQLNTKKKQLWIAGGIGVTPFLSGAESLRQSTRVKGGDIEMIYATADSRPYGIEALQAVEERNNVFNVTLFDKKRFGHVSFDALRQQIKDISEREIYICGPPPMLNALREEAEKLGFDKQLRYEEFNY